MEINLAKINLKKLSVPFALLVVIVAVFALRDTWMTLVSSLFENTLEASEVAEQGVAAFYTIDHAKGIDVWMGQYCEVATDDGCALFTDVYGPAYWPAIEQNEITTGCKTIAVALIDEYVEGKKTPFEVQVWLVDAELTNPFDDASEDKMEVYAVLKRLQGERAWVFERILFDNEVQKYQTPIEDQEG
jgi:hypothetical protein